MFNPSTHWNNERILRSHWNKVLLDLVRDLGLENVYVRILESGSYDNTQGAMKDLEARLGRLNVPRTFELFDITHKDELGRVHVP